jgi:hypothetical protein
MKRRSAGSNGRGLCVAVETTCLAGRFVTWKSQPSISRLLQQHLWLEGEETGRRRTRFRRSGRRERHLGEGERSHAGRNHAYDGRVRTALTLLRLRRLLRRADVESEEERSEVDRVSVGELDGCGHALAATEYAVLAAAFFEHRPLRIGHKTRKRGDGASLLSDFRQPSLLLARIFRDG